jgi:hypothetical protein
MIDTIKEFTDPGATVALVAYGLESDLKRFQPDWAGTVEDHREVLSLVVASVPERNVRLVQMNRHDYYAWLDGREDSSALRSAWAATIVNRNE